MLILGITSDEILGLYRRYLRPVQQKFAMQSFLLRITNVLKAWFETFVLFFSFSAHQNKRASKDINDEPLELQDVPGPWPSLPVFGTTWTAKLPGAPSMNEFYAVADARFRRYGPLVKEEGLFRVPIVHVYDGGDIEKVVRLPSRYPIRPPMEGLCTYRKSRPDRYASSGLVNTQGEEWHALRMGLTPELTSTQTMIRYIPTINNMVDDFIHYLTEMRDDQGRIDNFHDCVYRLGMENICALILGRRMGFLERELTATASRMISSQTAHWEFSHEEFHGLPLWKVLPSKSYRKFVQAEETLYEIIAEFVETAVADNYSTFASDDDCHIFSSILKSEHLDIRDKKAGIIDFIMAGIEPVGNSLLFLLYQIAAHPDVQDKLYEEINRLSPNGSPITADELKNATYLKACVQETFRTIPTTPCLARIPEQDLLLQNHRIPAGTVLLCHTWHACLQEENFRRPEQFMPERWIMTDDKLAEGLKSERANFLVVPFGYGRRLCPGKRYSEIELQVIAAKMVQTFQLVAEEPLELDFQFLQFPKPPMKIILQDRNSSSA